MKSSSKVKKSLCASKRVLIAWAVPPTPKPLSATMGNATESRISRWGTTTQVAATKDGLITETQAHTGAKTDQQTIPDLVAEQKEHHGLCPPKLIYDKAGGNGKVRYAVEQASDGQTIVSAALPDYAGRSDRFGPYDFSLSEDDTTLTCPQGKSTDVSYAFQSGDGQPELILVADSESGNGRAITLSRGDINEIQMAKGAIRAGQEILLKEAGISAEEVDRVIIAGAFGTYIDVENAVNIGMLPHIPVHRFSQNRKCRGDGCGTGVAFKRETGANPKDH